MAVGLIVAPLAATELISYEEHRHALGQQQSHEEVALVVSAEDEDLLVVGRVLGAAVPRSVVIAAVGVEPP